MADAGGGWGTGPWGTMPWGGGGGLGCAYYAYDAVGSVTGKVLGGIYSAYFEYDPANRISAIRNCFANGSPLVYFGYGYDAGGRITQVLRESGWAVYYSYDDADRLTGEVWRAADNSQIYGFWWGYDAVGNRTQERRETGSTVSSYYEYDAANQLTQVHDLPADTWNYFAYDTRGNCLRALDTSGSAYFAWTSADLVDKIRWSDGKSNYFYYDARLRRFGMRDSDGLRYFTWDSGGMNLLLERSGAKAQTAAYAHGRTPIPGIGSTVAVKKTEVSTTYYQYPVYDHRGSVVRLLDGSGAVKAYYEYDAWGSPLRAETIGKSAPNRLRWQTNWDCLKDSNGQCYDLELRIYNSKFGRFLNRNPWGAIQGRYSLYDFAGNDPVSRVEPRSPGIYINEEDLESYEAAHAQGYLPEAEARRMGATIQRIVAEGRPLPSEHPAPPQTPAQRRSFVHREGTSSYLGQNINNMFRLAELEPPAGPPGETKEECEERIIKWAAGMQQDLVGLYRGEIAAIIATVRQQQYHEEEVVFIERILGLLTGALVSVALDIVISRFVAQSGSILGIAPSEGYLLVSEGVARGLYRAVALRYLLELSLGVSDEVMRECNALASSGRLSAETKSRVKQADEAYKSAVKKVFETGQKWFDACPCSP